MFGMHDPAAHPGTRFGARGRWSFPPPRGLMLVHRLICPQCSGELLSPSGIPAGQRMTCGRCGTAYDATPMPGEEFPVAVEIPDPPVAEPLPVPKPRRRRGPVISFPGWGEVEFEDPSSPKPKDRYLMVRLGAVMLIATALILLVYWKASPSATSIPSLRPMSSLESSATQP